MDKLHCRTETLQETSTLHNRMGQIVTLEEALHNFWDGSYKNTRRGLHNRMGRNLTLEEALHKLLGWVEQEH